jgi:proline iminopeptidase
MSELYPEIDPFRTHRVAVDQPHELYVEECGVADGIPALFLHGGPGSGCESYHRRFFDPSRYRLVLFDQRGCGRSTPHAALEGNTTQALVQDIETIRRRLGIEKWLVFGGSWGSTLALAYAQAHPQRVSRLILRGVFLCRDEEIQWFYQDGASRIFPDYWRDFVAPITPAERHDMVTAYYRRLTGDNELARLAAAKAWSLWEGRTASLLPNESIVSHFAHTRTALSLARIECHYFIHKAFLQPEQLLREAGKMADIPGVIVHGRYDLICPLKSAWELSQAWPAGRLEVIPDAGHAASEKGIRSALVAASDQFAEELS